MCSIEDCDTKVYARGFCRKHYQRNWRRGNPAEALINRDLPLIERFWQKIRSKRGCWLWTGAKTSKNYGLFWIGGPDRKVVLVHRWAYEHFVGSIPDGMEIDHLCYHPLCVRPEHLEAVTREDNVQRAKERRQKTQACAKRYLSRLDDM